MWSRRGHRLQFAEILSRCGRCNRHVEASFENGIGLHHPDISSSAFHADSDDEDFDLASLDDTAIAAFARDTAAAIGLPEERTQVLVRYWESRRYIADQRLTWCKDIELWQNLPHEADPATMFREEPPQISVCLRFGHKSPDEATDWKRLVEEFKDHFCNGCEARKPKPPRKK